MLALLIAFRAGLLSARVATNIWAVILPGMPLALTTMLLCSDDARTHVQRILDSIEHGVSVTFVPLVSATLGAIHATMPRSSAWVLKVGATYALGVVANVLVLLAIVGVGDVSARLPALRLLLSRCVPFALGFKVARCVLPRAKDVMVAQHVEAAS